MITNYSKNLYKMMEQIKIKPTETKKKGSGLLAPVKNFMKNTQGNDMVNQPAYRVAKYMNTIRNKRMEFINGGREATEI